MPINIEIKARDRNPTKTRSLAEQLSDRPVVTAEQHDTFFVCSNGRLKLREVSPNEGELIFYSRPDVASAKQSEYYITRVSSPEKLAPVLAAALGAWQTVSKTRVLFQVGQTRIHLDSVAGLGSFVELEVVLREGQPAQEGYRIVRELMGKLGIHDEDLVDCAYVDLLARTHDG
jgi:predicted adenylyl cyclase CyaB